MGSNDINEDNFRSYQRHLAKQEWDAPTGGNFNGNPHASGFGSRFIIGALGALGWLYLTQIAITAAHGLIQSSFSDPAQQVFWHRWAQTSWLGFATVSSLVVFGFLCAAGIANFLRSIPLIALILTGVSAFTLVGALLLTLLH